MFSCKVVFMKIIAILSQKGGAGKTTLAINLAVAANESRKQSAIIDIDPQASATNWYDSRDYEEPVVVSAQSARLQNVIDAAKEGGADIVFIDTAPHSESASLAAARIADYILIPCRPAILDLRAIGNTIDLAKLAGTKAAVVLTCVPPRGTLAQEAAEAVSTYGIDLCPSQIGQRAAFVHSITSGLSVHEYEPKGKASKEINALYKWINKQLK
jgi:chromosome partitioning protein